MKHYQNEQPQKSPHGSEGCVGMGQWSVPLVSTQCWKRPGESGLRKSKHGVSVSGMKKFVRLSPGMLQREKVRKMGMNQQEVRGNM